MTQCKYEILLKRIISGIAYHPIRIDVEAFGTRNKAFTVTADNADMGLLIGKDGVVIKAIQIVFRAIAAHNRMTKLGVFIRTSAKNSGVSRERKSGWNEQEAIDLADEIVKECGFGEIDLALHREGDCVALQFFPPPPEPLDTAIHTVLERYGKSYGKLFGLSMEQ